ncbi:hypothetical protein I3843_08G101600 [Carya illinoinensis]|nr:hypothetical protein I3843_08G101600 [Carya illinoinensis]
MEKLVLSLSTKESCAYLHMMMFQIRQATERSRQGNDCTNTTTTNHMDNIIVEDHPLQSRFHSGRPHPIPKLGTNGASGGPGMQAFFLESGRRSCGTGVFLPQRTGTNPQSSKIKPGCSPVLLPNRVVEALNLNVHALGLHMSPRKDNKCNHKGRDCISNKKKNGKELPAQCYVISQNRSSSPEIFLPKEWTY